MKTSLMRMSIVTAVLLFGCSMNSVPSIGDKPPVPSFTVDQTDPNYIIFKVTSAEGFMTNWDFGNGYLSQKMIDTVYFPFPDTYTVKLATSGKGGASIAKTELIIATTDPKICIDKYYLMLTGGCDFEEGKIWVIENTDSVFANGPSVKDSTGKYASTYNDPFGFYWWVSALKGQERPAPVAGSLDDEYVFKLRGFVYENRCHGNFYFNWKWANKLFNAKKIQYADTICSYVPKNPCTWKLTIDTTGGKGYIADSVRGSINLILTFTNDNYIGYCSGTSTYQILKLSPDTMYLRHELREPDNETVTGLNRQEWRYLRLVAKK
jgi:PKD repeat protein